MPATMDVGALLVLLDLLPVAHDVGGLVGDDVAEHVRVPAHELVVDATRDVGHRELAGLLREHRVEHHLVEQVAELVLERAYAVVARRSGRLLERLDDLVGLLEEVAGERVVGLLGVPRAAARIAQPLGELEQSHHLAAPRSAAPASTKTDVRWSGATAAVELRERDHGDVLVGQAETLQHHDRRVGAEVLEQRELHVGEHELVVALRDEQSARELGRVDARARRRRARRRPSDRRPSRTHARSANDTPGDQLHLDGGVGAQQRDRALGDRRTAGNRVHDLAVLVRGGDQRAAISPYADSRSGAAS